MQIKPAALSLIHPYANSFISRSSNITTIPELFDEKYLAYEYHDLIKACSEIHVTILDEDAEQIEWGLVSFIIELEGLVHM